MKQTEQRTIRLDELYIEEEFNYRGSIMMTEIQGLAQNIKEHGLMQPIIASEIPQGQLLYARGYRYKLLAGFRRTTAIKKILDWTTIPASIVVADDAADELCINVIENEERQDVPFHQSAVAIGRLRDLNLSEGQIMKRLNKTRGWVQVRLHYLDLPTDIQLQIKDHNESGNYAPVTQEHIRQLRTILLHNGEDKTYAAFKELRIGLCGGHKRINIAKVVEAEDEAEKHIKRRRTAVEQEMMINTIYEGLSEQVTNPMAKALAWALGNITDADLYAVCREWADSNGLTFTEPTKE